MSQITLINVVQNEVLPFLTKTTTRQQVVDRKRRAAERIKLQIQAFAAEEIHKASVEAKLREAGAEAYCEKHNQKWWSNFIKCERQEYVRMCEACRKIERLKYRCCLKWCPCCNWRVSVKRRHLMEVMTQEIYNVKHVVLTQRNFTDGLLDKIRQSRKNLLSLRRQKIFGEVTGGCASLEFTNEKKGWHLHWHLIIQSDFISEVKLAKAWGALVEQEYAIVKVLDVSEQSYLQEICKYVVKGSELAKWKPTQILEFVASLRGTRCFSTFGKFRELQKFARGLIECNKVEPENCECGSDSWFFGKDVSAAKSGVEKWQRQHA